MSEHEGRYGQELQPRPDASDASSFDDLAKGLASGTLSRGRALRMLGAALVGGAFASIPGAAWAACKQPFSKCTANTQCCSRQCIKNPKGNGKICGCPTGKTLCPAGNQCVTCTKTGEVVNQTTCKCECPSGQVVCNNACVSNVCSGNKVFNPASCKCECPIGQEVCSGTNTCVPSCDPTTGEVLVFDPDTNNCRCECPTGTELCGGECRTLCATGEQRNPSTCQCEAVVCSGSQQACTDAFPCGANNACTCFNTTEGSHACVALNFCSEASQTCQSSNDCPAGTACVRTCCPDNLCAPLCGITTPESLQAESQATQPRGRQAGGGNPARKPTL